MNLSTKGPARIARTAFISLLFAGVATGALAAPSDAKLQSMQQQLDALRAEISQLKSTQGGPDASALQAQLDDFAKQLADIKSAQDTASADIINLKAPPSGSTVITTLPNGKPAFTTADKRFTANIRAIVMMDTGKYFQKNNLPAAVTNRDLNSGTNFRRARFGIDGKLFQDFDYTLIYEFGGSGAEDAGHIQEAWAQYSGWKPWRIRVGAFEPNVGLAAAVSTSQMPLLERPSAAEAARSVTAGDSRSAIQLAGNGVFGEGDSGLAVRWFAATGYTGNVVGTINSTGSTAAQPFGEQQGYYARVALAPFQTTDWQAHIGANYQHAIQPNDAGVATAPRYPAQLRDRPELRLDGTRLVDTGAIDAKSVTVMGAELGATVQNFLVEGEYFKYKINRRLTTAATPSNPDFSGWYVQGVWVLTGEARPYNAAEARFDAPKPNYNFNPAAGTWGAFEVAARYSVLDLNYHACGAGRATPASPAACFDAVRGGEQKISTIGVNWYLNASIRMMLDYQHVDVNRFSAAGAQVGQKYNAVALRSQFNF